MERPFLGTDLKFIIEIESPGFDMGRDDFEVLLEGGEGSVLLHKEDMVHDENNKWYICFDTKDLGVGLIRATVTAHVPDDDFEDGIRDEVDKYVIADIRD